MQRRSLKVTGEDEDIRERGRGKDAMCHCGNTSILAVELLVHFTA